MQPNMMTKAKRLIKRWERTSLLEGMDGTEKANMAILLDTQAKQLIKEATQTSTTAGSEEWSGVALPLVRKVFGEIAAKNFVSVQPLSLPSGLVFYVDFQYGNTKLPFAANGSVYGTLTGAGSPSDGLYGAGRWNYSTNIKSKSVAATGITSASVTLADINYDANLSSSLGDGFQKFTIATSSLESSIDTLAIRSFYVSGSGIGAFYPQYTTMNAAETAINFIVSGAAATITTSSAARTVFYSLQPTATTRGDFEYRGQTTGTGYNQFNIPDIDLKFNSAPIVAKTRKLKAKWTHEIAQDLNAYHAVDAEAELTSMLSEYISMEIDLEILDMIRVSADTTDYWSARPGYEYTGATNGFVRNSSFYIQDKSKWFQTLGIKVNKISNLIHAKTMRGGANFMVVSPTVATIIEGMPGYNADTDGTKMQFAMGVEKIGKLGGGIQVYKNPYITENVAIMGFRGSTFLETGAVFAPYIPLIMTPLIYDPDTLQPRKGIMTRYAKKMVRKEFYGKIVFDSLNLV
jgi:hypothetical protein